MPKDKNEEEKPESSGCVCPNCGTPLMIVSGESNIEDMPEQEFDKLDDSDQRAGMEKEFNKKMGKLQEY